MLSRLTPSPVSPTTKTPYEEVVDFIPHQGVELVSFDYETGAGMDSVFFVPCDLGDGHQYVRCRNTNFGDDYYFVAKLEAHDLPRLLAEWLSDLLSQNGEGYNGEILLYLPHPIVNDARHLLPRDSVKEAIWGWCNLADEDGRRSRTDFALELTTWPKDVRPYSQAYGVQSWTEFAGEYGPLLEGGDVTSEVYVAPYSNCSSIATIRSPFRRSRTPRLVPAAACHGRLARQCRTAQSVRPRGRQVNEPASGGTLDFSALHRRSTACPHTPPRSRVRSAAQKFGESRCRPVFRASLG